MNALQNDRNAAIDRMVFAIKNLPSKPNGSRLLAAYIRRQGQDIYDAARERIRVQDWMKEPPRDPMTGQFMAAQSREEFFNGQGPQALSSEMIEMYRP